MKNEVNKKLEIPGPEQIGGINQNISNPGGKEPNLTPPFKKNLTEKDLNNLIAEKKKFDQDFIADLKPPIDYSTKILSLSELSKNYLSAYEDMLSEKIFYQSVYVDNYALTKERLYDFFDSRGILIEIGVDYTRVGYGSPLFCYQIGTFKPNEEEKYVELNNFCACITPINQL